MKSSKTTRLLSLLTVLLLTLSSAGVMASAEMAPAQEDAQLTTIEESSLPLPTATARLDNLAAAAMEPVTNNPILAPQAPQTFTVRFVNHDGELFCAVEVEAGQPVDAPIFMPMRSGYEFLHWQEAEDAAGAFAFGGSQVRADMTLTAAYAPLFAEVERMEEMSLFGEMESLDDVQLEMDEETTENGPRVVGKRDETLDGVSILIIEDLDLEDGDKKEDESVREYAVEPEYAQEDPTEPEEEAGLEQVKEETVIPEDDDKIPKRLS